MSSTPHSPLPTPHISPRPPRVFITAAEVSGDRHAAQLIRSLKEIDPTIVVEGHGGPAMAAAGAVIHRDTVANAAMGLRGALRAAEIWRLVRWTRRYFGQHRPDLWVGVDSWSMNVHFAKAARAHGVPTLKYVAPQLWAWAPWRMGKVRRWMDRVACILPFEEAYFRGHGVNATFVGHPLFDELPPGRGNAMAGDGGVPLPDRPPVVGLLPGSRRSEAAGNFGRMLEVAGRVVAAFPGATFLVPTTPATHPVVERALADVAGSPAAAAVRVERDAFDRLVPRCDLCLTVSGTATLHVASFRVPMIVVYAGSAALWKLVGQWVIQTRTFALVNLLAAPSPAEADPARHAVPEFIPWAGPTDVVADLAIAIIRHPERLAAQRHQLDELIRALDHPGASTNVARLALDMIAKPAPAAPAAKGAGN